MASRPVFIPMMEGLHPFVSEHMVEFEWFPGFSKEQAQRSIRALHSSAEILDLFPLLEISSKSPTLSGVELSAFNLQLKIAHQRMSVESAYQGSKVFEGGVQYQELYHATSRDAKKDARLANSGRLIAFRIYDQEFGLEPKTAFYDWLYLQALVQNSDLARMLMNYKGFTDIAFNPDRSLSCQARSAALYVSLHQRADFVRIIENTEHYLAVVTGKDTPTTPKKAATQLRLSFADEPS